MIDQTGRLVNFDAIPERVVCLVPSITELLFDFGLKNRIVGRTKFCIHPKKDVINTSKIGGTKNISVEQIKALKPDLVICSKEENIKEQVYQLESTCAIWVTDVKDLVSELQMLNDLAKIFNVQQGVINEIKTKSKSVLRKLTKQTQQTCLYLIWKGPYISIGNDTYINSVLEEINYKNVLKNSSRYPTITISEINDLKPDIIFLSSEPFPFRQKDIEELSVFVKHSKIRLVNGEFYSWYGSRRSHLTTDEFVY